MLIELKNFLNNTENRSIKDTILIYLGHHVKELQSDDLPLLEKIREKFFKTDDEDFTELEFYIKATTRSLKTPYLAQLSRKVENLPDLKEYLQKHLKRVDLHNLEFLAEIRESELFISIFNAFLENVPLDEKLALEMTEYCVEFRDDLLHDNWEEIEKLLEIHKKLSLNENNIIEIAKICAAKDAHFTYNIQKFGITDQIALIEIAKICARNHGSSTALNIRNFGITDQKALIEIAKICAEQDRSTLAENIKNFGFIHSEDLIEIAKICAAHDGRNTAQYIKNFGIISPEVLFEIAKICAAHDGGNTAKYIKNFGFKEQETLIEICKICFRQCVWLTFPYLKNFEITDQSALVEIAHQCAKTDPLSTAQHFKNFGIQNEATRIELTKVCAMKVTYIAENILNFEINDQDAMIEIAKICAQKDGMGTARHIDNFKIRDQQVLFEIAMICAKSKDTANYARNFKFSDPKMRVEFAKACAKNDPRMAECIYDFNINSQPALFEIALICADQSGTDTAQYFRCFYIRDPAARLEIAMRCFKQNAIDTIPYLSNFELDHAHREHLFIEELKRDSTLIHHLYAFKLAPELVRSLEDLKSDKAIIHLKDYAVGMGHFSQVIESIEKVRDPQARNNLISWLGSAFFLCGSELTAEQLDWVEKQGLLQAISDLPLPHLRHDLTNMLRALAQSQEARSTYEKLPLGKYKKYAWAKLLNAVAALYEKSVAENILKTSEGSFKIFKDLKKFGLLIRVHYQSFTEKGLSDEERKKVLEKTFLFKDKELLKQYYALSSIYDFNAAKLLKNWEDSLPASAEKAIKEKIPFGDIENLSQKYMETFGASRNPQALVLFASKMASLIDPKVTECLTAFATSVINGIFKEARYGLANNPHLNTLFREGKNKQLFEDWKKGSSEDISVYASESKEKKIPADRAWLKMKLIDDKHIDLSSLPLLRRYLTDPASLQEVKKELEQQRGERPSPYYRFQKLCFDLVDDDAAKLKILEELAGVLTVKEFAKPEFLNDVKGLIEGSKKSSKMLVKVVDSDDPIDLLLCGTEVSGSCQRLDGDPKLNKGLLGYLVDGKNRLLAIKDQDGKILARCMLRLLWDGEKPVLFRERLYPDGINEAYRKALNGVAMKKALVLGIALACKDDKGERYTKPLQALGGPAPFEYSDAGGGVQFQGMYTIHGASFLS